MDNGHDHECQQNLVESIAHLQKSNTLKISVICYTYWGWSLSLSIVYLQVSPYRLAFQKFILFVNYAWLLNGHLDIVKCLVAPANRHSQYIPSLVILYLWVAGWSVVLTIFIA